jgi:hypothetical protein
MQRPEVSSAVRHIYIYIYIYIYVIRRLKVNENRLKKIRTSGVIGSSLVTMELD